MTDPAEDRRVDSNGWEPGDYLAFVYTMGFLAMVAGVMYFAIPKDNVQIVNTLVTIMSTIQIGIGKCYYDRAKADISMQKSAAVQQAKASSVLQAIAQAAPSVVTVPAATGTLPPAPGPIVADAVKIDAQNVTVDQPKGGSPQ